MSRADPPRWNLQQNHSESHLPHIVTGLEHEQARPLTPLAQSKQGWLDKFKDFISTSKRQPRIHDPLTTKVAQNPHPERHTIPQRAMPSQVQHSSSEGTINQLLPSIPSYPIPQVQHILSEETPLPSIVVNTPRDEIPSYPIPQVQHTTLSEGTPLPSIAVKTPRDEIPPKGPPPSIAVKTLRDEISSYVSNQQTPPSNQLKAADFVPVEASRGLEAAREAASQIRTIASVPVQTTVSAIANVDSPINLLNSVSSFIQTLSKFNDIVQSIGTIHPYAQAACAILSIPSKIIIDQTNRDNSVVSLLSKMNEVYAFLMKQEIRDIESMKTVVERICHQTLECSYFIREYSQNKKFRTRLLNNLISETNTRVLNYNNVFDALLQQFRDRAAGDTLVVVHRIWEAMKDLESLVEDSDLNSMPYVRGAGLDTRKVCLEGTRNGILDDITTWINNTEDNTRVFWLHGNAGTGKSSIAHTIANRFRKLGRLGSCYCFNRNEMLEPRHKNIFTTIARDLADRDKNIRRELVNAVHLDTSLKNTTDILQQWKELIMKPAKTLSEVMVGPIVIVIDALDESGGADSRQHILRILAGQLDDDECRISKLPPHFRILLISRPVPDIYDALNGIEHVQQKSMDSISSLSTQSDILRYVSWELSGLTGIQSQVSASLAHVSGGLFEWARLACEYIKGEDAGTSIMERFEVLMTRNNKDTFVPLLDRMYTLTLETIFPPERRSRFDRLDRFRSVMAQILATEEPLPLASLNAMRHHFDHPRKADVSSIIRPMGALLSGTTDPTATIRPLHASFTDFLTDKNRSGEFFIDISHIHNDLAFASLGVMKDGLQFNICRIPTSYLPNSEVPDLAQRVKRYISPELSYSCRFWTDHLRRTPFNLPLANAVREFFDDEWLLFWIEALSLLKTINTCASWLSNVLRWVAFHPECRDISADAADTQRFVRMFGGTISFSTPHLYLSALPFSPRNSRIYNKFADRFCNVLQIVRGHNITWPVIQGVLYHDGPLNTVHSVVFSPDGKRIASGSSDHTIRLWDAETRELLRPPLMGHEGAVLSVVFSPDGKRILSGSHDRTIRLWDAETGVLLRPPLKGHKDAVLSVVFSPVDGKYIVSGSDDNTILLWNAETGGILKPPLIGHQNSVSSVAFSPDGRCIVSGSHDQTIRLWDAKTGSLLQSLEGHEDQVLSVAFSPNGKRILSGSYDQTVRLWDAEMGKLLRVLKGHQGCVGSVAFSPDGECVVSASDDKTIRLWHPETGNLFRLPLKGHEHSVVSVAFSPDSKRIVSGSGDSTIHLWDAETVELLRPALEGHEGRVLSVAFSPDSKCIVSGSRDKTIRLWDVESGALRGRPLEGHESWVLSVTFSQDGKHIASGSRDKTIQLWDAESGELLGILEGHKGLVRSVAFSRNGKRIVSGSDDATIRLWDVESGELLKPPLKGHEGRVWSVAFSPDYQGRYIVSGSQDSLVLLWDAESGELLQVLEGHKGQVFCVAFSPNGKYVASGSHDQTIHLWDTKTGELLQELEGHRDWVLSVGFSPNSKHIVSGSDDKTIRLWDVETGELLGPPLEGHEGSVNSVAFSPNGKHIVSGSDKTIRVWDSEIRKWSLQGSNLIRFSSHLDHNLIDTVDLVDEIATFSGHELSDLVEVTRMGWVHIGPKHKLLFCVPPTCHPQWYRSGMQIIMPVPVQLDLSCMAHGHSWGFCYDGRQDMFTIGIPSKRPLILFCFGVPDKIVVCTEAEKFVARPGDDDYGTALTVIYLRERDRIIYDGTQN